MQGANAESSVESTRHSKVELGSEEEKLNDGEESVVGPEGPESIRVSGGVMSVEPTILIANGFSRAPPASPTAMS